jgi:hypothetical protein
LVGACPSPSSGRSDAWPEEQDRGAAVALLR